MPSFLTRFGLLLIASYGLLYFSHNSYVPLAMQHYDFLYFYYPMYQEPLDLSAAGAPFIYRQVSALATHALYAAGFYYPNEVAFSDPAYDPRVFFAALSANFFALVGSAALSGGITKLETGGFVFPLVAGLLCLLSFHSQSVVITGLTEGMSWLFFAALYLMYAQERRAAFAVVLAVSIFQRELIPVAFALIAAFSLLIGVGNRRYNRFVLATSLLCFGAYLLIPLYLVAAPGFENQFSLSFLIGNLIRGPIGMHDLAFLVLLSQNVILIAVLTAAVVWFRSDAPPKALLVLILTFASILIIGLAEGIGANIGRAASLLSPAFAALAARDLFKLEQMSKIPHSAR